jgi:hypothetical protein
MAVVLVLFPQPFFSCDAETAGESIRFNTAVQGITEEGESASGFETAKGWEMTLASAHAVFGPVYLYGADSAELLDGASIRLEGTAEKNDESIPFRALITIPDEGTARIVQNIAADTELEDVSDKPGKIVVQALLDVWFSEVDFSTLTETDEDGNYLFTEDTQAWTALVQAIRNRYAYRVVWSKK